MKQFPLPIGFDAKAFAIRYGINFMTDIFVVDGVMSVPDSVPDRPVFDLLQPPTQHRVADLFLDSDGSVLVRFSNGSTHQLSSTVKT